MPHNSQGPNLTNELRQMPRLLFTAYACDPMRGSESGAGWGLLVAASRNARHITLITRCNEAPHLEAETQKLNCPIDIIRITTPFEEGSNVYLKYVTWLIKTSLIVRKLSANHDIFHHATFASDWLPAPMILGLSVGTKVVWGPVGGNTYPPLSITRQLPIKSQLKESVRRLVTIPVRSLTRALLKDRVDAFISLNNDSIKSAPKGSSVVVHPNCVIDYGSRSRGTRQVTNNHHKTLLFVGRILEWKGVFLALEAFKTLPESWKFVVVGDGPDMNRLRSETASITNRTHLVGHVDHAEVKEYMDSADVLIFPSLHDSLGWVAAEAAASALPVVCLDLGGVRTMAGNNAVVVPTAPEASLNKRLALAVLGASKEQFPILEDWTQENMDSFIMNTYASVLQAAEGR
jgi:glycosyltransferase involved in cell wall biosynthesis